MEFKVGDIVLMNSPEWPYLNQVGKIRSIYTNGYDKVSYVVRTISEGNTNDVGISPELCIDARYIIREKKLNELLYNQNL